VVRRALLVIVLAAAPARADRRPSAPCSGCTLDVPKADHPVPLLVVLHGDRQRATPAGMRWKAAARAKGWAVLALQCPTAEGCKDSWWQWDGDPAWLHAQIARVTAAVAIDRTRIALVGWSGGATYIGMRATAWNDGSSTAISAIVIHGGGMAPASSTCPTRALPSYFLVGDRNPLHRLAVDLRDYLDGCKQKVVWDLVKRGDHAREDRALDRAKAGAILDWLAAHPRADITPHSAGRPIRSRQNAPSW